MGHVFGMGSRGGAIGACRHEACLPGQTRRGRNAEGRKVDSDPRVWQGQWTSLRQSAQVLCRESEPEVEESSSDQGRGGGCMKEEGLTPWKSGCLWESVTGSACLAKGVWPEQN